MHLIIGVVVGVVMREEEMIHLRRLDSHAVHLVRRRKPAVEHHPLPPNLHQERRPPTQRTRRRRTRPQNDYSRQCSPYIQNS